MSNYNTILQNTIYHIKSNISQLSALSKNSDPIINSASEALDILENIESKNITNSLALENKSQELDLLNMFCDPVKKLTNDLLLINSREKRQLLEHCNQLTKKINTGKNSKINNDKNTISILLQHETKGLANVLEQIGKERLSVNEREVISDKLVKLSVNQLIPPFSFISETATGEYPKSSWDICNDVSDAIGIMNDSYLKVYEQALTNYVNFYQDFSDQIITPLSSWITASEDGNNVILNVRALESALNTFFNEYFIKVGDSIYPKENAVLYPIQNGDGSVTGTTNKEDADNWAKELGMPEHCVIQMPDGTWVVSIDYMPVENMIEGLPKADKDGNAKLDNARYQAWKSGFDVQDEQMKTTLQTMTQKYSNANSNFDNLVKILSSTINSLHEADIAFLRI